MRVRMANARGLHAHEHFAIAGMRHGQFLQFQRTVGLHEAYGLHARQCRQAALRLSTFGRALTAKIRGRNFLVFSFGAGAKLSML